ncbi:MAG: SDR family oxidoreductase [Lachnospiraceae bacterium]|nr:SDR family oxidoreductase [Lachnospiraceae bacterium]
MYDFQDKYAVVTGAAKGIGRAIAERFVKEGVKGLAILDYDEELAKKTSAELDESGSVVVALKCNVADYDEVQRVFAELNEKWGRIDILVNNAGITKDKMFHKMSYDQMHDVMNVNFFGVYNCCAAVINGMRDRCYGKIVNISSTSAYGNIGQVNYAASKGAINGFTRSLAKESGRKNITVNAVLPGGVDTEMMRAIPEEKYQANLAAHPMGRLGSVDEIANLVMFLSSDESSYVSGECIITSGSWIIH